MSAYANGKWTGPGIGSAGIAAARSIGYAEASDALGAAGGGFGTASADGSAVLVRCTLAGDTNLDGTVDFVDLARLAQNYNVTDGSRTWAGGDFNYDGTVDFIDLARLAQNYNTALPGEAIPGAPAEFASDLAAAFAAVPEPTMWVPLAASLLLSRGRRRSLVG